MLATKILETCRAQGVTLSVLEGGQLKVWAPKGKLNDEFLKSIKAEKEILIRLLSIHMAIAELNRLGIRMMEVPRAKRQEAFALEGMLTKTANTGDREQFLKLLDNLTVQSFRAVMPPKTSHQPLSFCSLT